jgi:hypothetical protein
MLIPKNQTGILTTDIFDKLQEDGYEIKLRTLQRYLQDLLGCTLFSIENYGELNKPRWRWIEGAEKTMFPEMSLNEALVFKFVELFLEPLLPPTAKPHIQEYFEISDKTLKKSTIRSAANRVRIIPNTLILQKAKIEPNVLDTIYNALLEKKTIKAKYKPRDGEEIKSYELNPLGLAFSNSTIYLVATLKSFFNGIIRQFALHRFKSVEITNTSITEPHNFDFDKYIDDGNFFYKNYNCDVNTISLELKLQEFLFHILLETPISDDQIFEELDDGTYLLKATVIYSEQLKWWIRSFSSAVKVLKPIRLQNELAKEIQELHRMYFDTL